MSERTRLGLQLRQTLSLTPELRLGMRLLSLPLDALLAEIQTELDQNPSLELAVPLDWTVHPGDRPAPPPDLGGSLRAQLALERLTPAVARAAAAITWSLDGRGWLDVTLADIAELSDTTNQDAEEALVFVQALGPPGIAARSLAECLELQLAARGLDRAEARVALGSLPDLADGAWGRAARATGLKRERLKQIAAILPGLDPAPGAHFGPEPPLLEPDLVLRFEPDGTPVVSLRRGTDPDLRLVRTTQDPDVPAAEAQGLIRALRFRRETLLRVTGALVAHQFDHLRDPSHALRPLTRQELAATLSLHPSTVGRAVAGKSIATPRGTVPLDSFFPGSIGAEGTSSHAVKMRLKALVQAESSDAVLSDAALAQCLQSEGVDIARRTVAKYRGCLSIPPSHVRKRRKARRGTGGTTPNGRHQDPLFTES